MRFWAILEASSCGDGVFAIGRPPLKWRRCPLVERILGKDEVIGSIPNEGSKTHTAMPMWFSWWTASLGKDEVVGSIPNEGYKTHTAMPM